MSDKIEPALTPEEWAVKRAKGLARLGPSPLNRSKKAEDELWVEFDSGCAEEYIGDRHALAALCLHGQPFGFTHEMLRAIQETNVRNGSERALLVAAARARIAALLPPRKP